MKPNDRAIAAADELDALAQLTDQITGNALSKITAAFPDFLAALITTEGAVTAPAADYFIESFDEYSRTEWEGFVSALTTEALAGLLSAIPYSIDGNRNSRLALALSEKLSVDEAQHLYRFAVLVTKLYS